MSNRTWGNVSGNGKIMGISSPNVKGPKAYRASAEKAIGEGVSSLPLVLSSPLFQVCLALAASFLSCLISSILCFCSGRVLKSGSKRGTVCRAWLRGRSVVDREINPQRSLHSAVTDGGMEGRDFITKLHAYIS